MSKYFTKDEEKFYLFFRNIREPLFQPLAEFLAKTGVKPDTISYIGLFMTFLFAYFFSFNPWLAFFFLVLNLFFDMLDGSVARALKKESAKGEFTDKAIDYLSFFIVFFSFLYFGLMNAFLAAVFTLNFALVQAFITFGQIRGLKLFPVIRPKLIIYFFFIIWLITGFNYFDPLLLVLSVYLIVSNLFLFIRIRCSL